jgi:hypothetical protein
MAKLEVRTAPPVVPEDVYILTLTKAEAETILAVTGVITGSEIHSRRAYTTRVYRVLSTALGIYNTTTDLESRNGYVGLHFRNVEGLNISPENV